MKRIVERYEPEDQIVIKEALRQGGIIVSVYKNKLSVLLSDLLLDDKWYGFSYLKSNTIADWHSVSTSKEQAIQKNLTLDVELHYFNSLQDFAKAILKYGWET